MERKCDGGVGGRGDRIWNDWGIRLLVTVRYLFANISWMTRQIHMIKLALKSAHQFFSNDIWYII